MAISFVKPLHSSSWSATQFKYLEIGGNARFLALCSKYSMCSLSLLSKYTSPAAVWYRKALRAQMEGVPRPLSPEGVNPLPTQSKEEGKDSWLGSIWSKASNLATHTVNEVRDIGIEVGSNVYRQTKGVGSILVEKSVEVGESVGRMSESLVHQFVEKSREVGGLAFERSTTMGEKLLDQSKLVGLSLYDRSNEFLRGRNPLKRKTADGSCSARG